MYTASIKGFIIKTRIWLTCNVCVCVKVRKFIFIFCYVLTPRRDLKKTKYKVRYLQNKSEVGYVLLALLGYYLLRGQHYEHLYTSL